MQSFHESIYCIGCGGLVPSIEGPTHRYLESSAGCWAVYGEVLAREYSDPAYAVVHRQTVDAYAVQHPGRPSAQSIQSVAIHLIQLCLILELGFSDEAARHATPEIASRKATFRWLAPPQSMGRITAVDVSAAKSAQEHVRSVHEWAESAWRAWSDHHEQIKRWMPHELGGLS